MLLALALKGMLMSLMLCMDIGVVNTATINTGLRGGFRPAFAMGLGSSFGDLTYATLSMLGMAVILQIDVVKFIVWIGGSIILVWLTISMARQAWRQFAILSAPDAADQTHAGTAPPLTLPREFFRGLAMALASPSAIIWFAAVGGAIIAQSTVGSMEVKASFLGGFFLGAVIWSVFIATISAAGKRWAGDKLKFYCNLLSGALFAYFAVDVFFKGYSANLNG